MMKLPVMKLATDLDALQYDNAVLAVGVQLWLHRYYQPL